MRVARQALTGLSRRHEAIASNIANIDTPGYQRREVNFEDALKKQLAGEQPQTQLAVTDAPHDLMVGNRSRDVNRKYGLSPGRVSQKRCQIHRAWHHTGAPLPGFLPSYAGGGLPAALTVLAEGVLGSATVLR